MGLVVGYGVVEWVATRTDEYGNFGCATGIGWERDGKLVAGVAYNDFNGVNMCTHIALEGAMTKKFLWAIFDYPFNQAKVNRITALVGEGNEKSLNLCRKLGFTEEARLDGAHPTGDMVILKMWRKDCRWLGIKQ
ncbi:Uncharacterized conserved protein [Janthinobacterium sp. Marseille]|nr:GNAT family N-acetyltransferase [Janthinobacterium sp. Marseille]ABR91756.1 Uncharacterized conserved protein [Janthinobacterium sp. Marseille]